MYTIFGTPCSFLFPFKAYFCDHGLLCPQLMTDNMLIFIIFSAVKRVTKKFGFRDVGDDEDFILYWTDYSVSLERVMEMKKYQVCL